jgi:microcystin synthetase protein McyA
MMHRHEDIERLAAQHCRRLESLIDFCATGGELGLTPADFPEADIDQQELDDILEQFGELP